VGLPIAPPFAVKRAGKWAIIVGRGISRQRHARLRHEVEAELAGMTQAAGELEEKVTHFTEGTCDPREDDFVE